MKGISVLTSVYRSAVPNQLDAAIRSVMEQTLRPSEIVIVKDGQLTEELDAVIARWVRDYRALFRTVQLSENMGLGLALKEGLKHCSYEFIARMDVDDISCPERFYKESRLLDERPDVDLVSSWMGCFDLNEEEIAFVRRMPLCHEEIIRLVKFRNPINGAPAMYRRAAAIKAGGYMDRLYVEDYHLWVRMMMNGSKFAAIPEVLYLARLEGLWQRRKGARWFLSHYNLQKEFLAWKFITLPRFVLNVFFRFLSTLIPVYLTGFIRSRLLKL